MKKIIMMLFAFVIIGGATELKAQSYIHRLSRAAENAAKRKIEQKVEQKVEEKVEDAVEEMVEAAKNNANKANGDASKDKKGGDANAENNVEVNNNENSAQSDDKNQTPVVTPEEVWDPSLKPFCCLEQGAELKYVTKDAKGKKETSSSITKIVSVTESNGTYNVTQTISVYEDDVEIIGPMTVTSVISKGNVSMALAGGAAVEVSSSVPVIPANLEVGKELGCGDVVVNVGGIQTTQTITSHKVVAREELTTSAGTFDCYVVEQHYTAKVLFVKADGIQKIWYARGIGNVKTEVYDAKGKLASIQTLTSFKK